LLINSDQSGGVSEEVKARDRERLREMTQYCRTNDCLRAYILRYFGETAAERCDGCANCHTAFELTDISADAQKILSCVIRTGEKFGMTMIADILRGKTNEKIRSFGFDKLSTFGISDLSEDRLRQTILHLAQNGYLHITDGQYPIIKRGDRADEVLKKAAITMKTTKEEDAPRERRHGKSTKAAPVSKALFEKLRTLRKEIAEEQGVPAFMIFHDSTLTDLCMKLPRDKNELRDVSGVGRTKIDKFGDRFLSAIADFARDNGAAIETAAAPATVDETVELSDEAVTISAVADRINCVRLQQDVKKLTGAKINEWLMENGYLHMQKASGGKSYKVPTEQGRAAGISTEERMIRGEKCWVNAFNRAAQEMIVAGVRQLGL
ncbi:MAG: HRDC domain-containing protein, partial [Clostridiales bacterium]|nr:HRDC domain-containing protein [Clostridiales bacterium]